MPAHKGSIPWNAGTSKGWTDRRGYRWIYVTENGKRRAKREHRHIMELSIGRLLSPEEIVHHENGVNDDNRIENLRLTTHAEHTTHHHLGTKQSELTKRRIQVMANYREDNKRLKEINTDLLEALETLVSPELNDRIEKYQDVCEAMQSAKAAISKARGES